MKFTPQFQRKLEELLNEAGYILRYEKGQFKSGWCIIKESKVILVNAFYPLEGKINALVDILKTVEIDLSLLSDKSKKTLAELAFE